MKTEKADEVTAQIIQELNSLEAEEPNDDYVCADCIATVDLTSVGNNIWLCPKCI